MTTSILPTYARADLEFVSGKGSWLIEASGSQFLDSASGIAVNSLGHSHPELVSVINLKQKNFGMSQIYIKSLSSAL